MNRWQFPVAATVLLLLLVTVFYPVLFLGQRVAPEASLRTSPPWKAQLGPSPPYPSSAVHAARHLGPRLAAMAREGTTLALWNPLIGGGRGGWLTAPSEGGTPLVLLAVLLARPGWTWTALVAIEVLAAFVSCYWLLRRQRLPPWPAATGALCFALAAPSSSLWLDWKGPAVALGPLLLLPALATAARWRLALAGWTLALLLVVICGPPLWPFLAAAAVFVFLGHQRQRSRRTSAAVFGFALALLLALPLLWLQRAAAEPGASLLPPSSPASIRLVELVRHAPPAERASSPPLDLVPSMFLGWPILALAALAFASPRRREAAPWFGVFGAAALLAAVPAPALLHHPSLHPAPVLALAAAALAAFGLEGLLGFSRPRAHVLGGAVACLAALATLLPAASATLALAPADDPPLPAPLASLPEEDGARVVGLVGALPADSAAAFGLADLRAADLRQEPTYAHALGAQGELSIARALDPALGRLGARFLLEPAPLHLVSGAIFAGVEVTEVERASGPTRLFLAEAPIPVGASRVGLPSSLPTNSVLARIADQVIPLRRDEALAGETDAWNWFAVPPVAADGTATLAVAAPPNQLAPSLALAWDRSGLLLRSEEEHLRVWERRGARPFVHLVSPAERRETAPDADPLAPSRAARGAATAGAGSGGRASIERIHRRPSRVEVAVTSQVPAILVLQVKYRPLLFRATVNGRAVATERVESVWTGIPVAAGRSEVVLAARVPTWTLSAPSMGALLLLGLVISGRGA